MKAQDTDVNAAAAGSEAVQIDVKSPAEDTVEVYVFFTGALYDGCT